MPFVRIDVLAGRPPAVLEALIAAVSETVARTLEVPIERVRVVVNEVPPHLWGIGGVPASRVPGRLPAGAAAAAAEAAAGVERAAPPTSAPPDPGPNPVVDPAPATREEVSR